MLQRMGVVRWILICLLALAAAGPVLARDLAVEPPGDPYRKVSQLVPLPDFIPGMGVLYVDPATLPVGPFLAYDRSGTLVALVLMIPVEDLERRTSFLNVADAVAGWFPTDHVDVEYNPGHPGVEKPHWHVILWNIPHEEHLERLR